ncbi:MAG TPA: hypothetical protein VFM65_11060 [Flavobacteriaceae bacterium]|nr:hypothetical protein [Flavobacteriaceae bacterium]
MNNKIQGFATTEGVQKADLQIEIENWESQIDFMKKELVFYLKLVRLPALNITDPSFFLQGLQEVENTNETFEKLLLNYKNSLDGLNECEDIQCESYYMETHEEIQDKIKKHQLRFRAIKSQIFLVVQKI